MIFCRVQDTDCSAVRVQTLPESVLKRNNDFVKAFDPRLFVKWNRKYACLEIWEKSLKGKEYLVIHVNQNGNYREIDYRDIQELYRRSRLRKSVNNVLEETDEANRFTRENNERRFSRELRGISLDTFNKVFHNPVIRGTININP